MGGGEEEDEERHAWVWSWFLLLLLLLSPEELEVDHGSQDGQLHQDDDAQQQLIGHQPPGHGAQNLPAATQMLSGVHQPGAGAVQLLPLPAQLLDDVGTDLVRLRGDALAPLDALGGAGQSLVALEQQRALGLLGRLGGHRERWRVVVIATMCSAQ